MKAPGFFYRNAGLGSLLATISNAAAMFLIFRMAYHHLGAQVVGTWALIQSVMVISGLAGAGSAENVTRLVAIDRAEQGAVRVRTFLATGLLVNTTPASILGIVIVLPTYFYVAHNYGHLVAIPVVTGLVACSLLFGIFNSVAAILSGCLDGLGLMALRGYLACISNVVFATVGYVSIYHVGGVGLGLSYVGYAACQIAVFTAGIHIFRDTVGANYKRHTVRELAWKTVNFNAKFLLMSLCKLLMDPICKVLIGRFANLDSVAIFDLANKVTTQARVLYQATLQSVLPMVSRATAHMADELRVKLVSWNERVARLSLYTMSLIVLVSSYISQFALGRVDQRFVLIVSILALGNVINTIGLIGYYVDVGSGQLGRLVKVFCATAAINVTLGYALGRYFGATGIAISFATALGFAGITTARPILGSPFMIIRAIVAKTTPEILLFASTAFVGWIVLQGSAQSRTFLNATIVLGAAAVSAALFLVREAPNFAQWGARLPPALQAILARTGMDEKRPPA